MRSSSTTTFTSHTGTANPDNALSYWDARKRLEASGWTLLGAGAFGAAYSHPDCPDTVLKVGSLGVLSTAENDGWLTYIRINGRTKSRHAPQVHAVELYDGYFYAELEPLEHIDRDTFEAEGLQDYHWDDVITDDVRPSMAAYLRRTDRHLMGLGKQGISLCRDVHRFNYMRRPSTGEIVLTDPWAN